MRFALVVLACLFGLSVLSGSAVVARRVADSAQCIEVEAYSNVSVTWRGVIDAPSGHVYWRRDQLPFVAIAAAPGFILVIRQKEQGYVGSGGSMPFTISDLMVAQRRSADSWFDSSTLVMLQSGIRTESGDAAMYQFGAKYVRLSPDGRTIAFVWADADQQMFLTRVRLDGTLKHTVSLREVNPLVMPQVDSWSADGRYLLIAAPLDSMSGSYPLQIWDADLLQMVVPSAALAARVFAWSPAGDGNSLIAMLTDAHELKLYSVTSGMLQSVTLPPHVASEDLRWSPDGKYLAVWGYDSSRQNGFGVNYDINTVTIIAADGTILHSGLAGLYRKHVNLGMVTGQWTPDGKRWLFLREADYAPDQRAPALELFALDVATGTEQVLESHIAYQWGREVFTVLDGDSFPLRRRPPEIGDPGIILVTAQANGANAIEVMDSSAIKRTMLVRNAEAILRRQSASGVEDIFARRWSASYQRSLIFFTWQQAGREALTWTTGDGMWRGTLDLGWIDMAVSGWTSDEELWFSGMSGSTESIGVVDVRTGNYRILLEGAPAFDGMAVVPQPGGDEVLIRTNRLSGSSLFLVDRREAWTKTVDVSPYSFPIWSPDGAEFAIIDYQINQNLMFVRAAADGTTLRRHLLGYQPAGGALWSPNFLSWTQCSTLIANLG